MCTLPLLGNSIDSEKFRGMANFEAVLYELGLLQEMEIEIIGNTWQGKCPFHEAIEFVCNDRTKSFFLDTEKQVFHCSVCKRSGNVLHFVMQYLEWEGDPMNNDQDAEWYVLSLINRHKAKRKPTLIYKYANNKLITPASDGVA